MNRLAWALFGFIFGAMVGALSALILAVVSGVGELDAPAFCLGMALLTSYLVSSLAPVQRHRRVDFRSRVR